MTPRRTLAAASAPTTHHGVGVVVDARPLGGRDRLGQMMFVIDLTVVPPGGQPVRTRLSVGVPEAWLGQLAPGAEVPVIVTVGDAGMVVTPDFRSV